MLNIIMRRSLLLTLMVLCLLRCRQNSSWTIKFCCDLIKTRSLRYTNRRKTIYICPTLKSRREDGNSFEEVTFKSSQNGDERNQTKQIKSNV